MVRQGPVWHVHRRWLWQGNGMLYLTTRRFIFIPIRLTISHGHEWNLAEIEVIGSQNVPRWASILRGIWGGWYVQMNAERHWFSALPWDNSAWLRQLTGAGLPVGESRDLGK